MNRSVLVVDDDKTVAKAIEKLLRRVHYNVRTAQSGQEALEKIRGNHFDLIITDIRMPGMNGFSLIKKIRLQLWESGKLPVPEIVMTGYDSKDYIKEALELNVADFIYKPFDIKELLVAVEANVSAGVKYPCPGLRQKFGIRADRGAVREYAEV